MQPAKRTEGTENVQPVTPAPVITLLAPAPTARQDRLLRLAEVEHLTGLKKSSLYGMARTGKFVKPIKLSARCVAWSEAAVLQWIADRVAGVQQ